MASFSLVDARVQSSDGAAHMRRQKDSEPSSTPILYCRQLFWAVLEWKEKSRVASPPARRRRGLAPAGWRARKAVTSYTSFPTMSQQDSSELWVATSSLEKTRLRSGAGVFLAGPSMFEARLIERGEVIDASVGRGGDGESGSESTMTRARAYINRGGRTDCAIGGPVEEEDRRVPMSLQALSGGLAVVQQGDARGRARRAAREEERKGDFPTVL